MTVIIVERVSASLRGDLSRWMLEPRTGVFVGKLSAPVRDKLWELVCEKTGAGSGALLVQQADAEQGFALRAWGEPRRGVVDFDGLHLVRVS